MMIRVEFISHLREITDMKSFQYYFEEKRGEPLLSDVLESLEQAFTDKGLVLLEEGGVKKGLLVFKRKESGGLDRVMDIGTPVKSGESLVIGTGMEGG